ncbi:MULTISPECIES: PEP-CTERM sorting domain-containing protein [unclassified Lentimonas]|uniref:PEP-CTERM sorting domain-containing protein n=1 Tax=unclassified Lentimonas TaxID=2630993 RepID=UPI001321C0FD|nr:MULTISPECIES: PEP-CTERM sorting domain-containing protein [unclassified Lentimonas]CAA6676331.1 Unannotated [Lentimonas sp. CC4]CAA6683779.1 Unannotated [Lentimonas sp. CC6]CAA7077826.1 Unannotated [Lentimonas sp. CC4]CAA7169756.1 Unannotated [Lentimonas sp. CC21]CAA7179874.1 Unannotated [Lentimonas sp. CC8]
MKTKNQTTLLFAAFASLALAQVSNAETIAFTDFNNVDTIGANAVSENGAGSITSLVRTNPSGDYLFKFTYFDGVETLTFDLNVDGFSGSTVTQSITTNTTGNSGEVTLGATAADVGLVGSGFGVGTNIAVGETLLFTVTNLVYTGGSATFDGFNLANGLETSGSNHKGIVGSGTGLFEARWSGGSNEALTTGGASNLYISSAGSASGAWGVSDLDFTITTAIPEPGTYALLAGLTGLAFVMIRRRRS